MEHEDIYTLISQNVMDVHTLMSTCYVNKTIKKVCSTKYFWEPIFIKNNLPLPFEIYTNVSDWLYEYKKNI